MAFAKWSYLGDDRIKTVDVPKRPKKVTGSRIGAILGMNTWKSEFGAWCEVCRVAEEPFEDSKYTIAGKIIEPKLVEFCRHQISRNIKNPEQYYNCSDAKSFKHYDFFNDKVFGGMWDGVVLNGDDIVAVIEAKTSSRPQDWQNGVPEHYAVQGLLYAALLGVDDVYFPVAFLFDKDYDNPEAFVCTDDNTTIYHLSVSEEGFIGKMDVVRRWWSEHVDTGISPVFDEKTDKKFLDIARTNEISVDAVKSLAEYVDSLEDKLNTIREQNGIADLEKELKTAKDNLKESMIKGFSPNDKFVSGYGWIVTKSTRKGVDSDKLKADGLFERYSKETDTYTLKKEG